MKIDVKHTAELSRITLTKEELDKFTPQMETILESASILKDVDTKNVQPMKKHIPFSDTRDDIAENGLIQEEAVKNAPHSENGYVKVYGKIFGDIEES